MAVKPSIPAYLSIAALVLASTAATRALEFTQSITVYVDGVEVNEKLLFGVDENFSDSIDSSPTGGGNTVNIQTGDQVRDMVSNVVYQAKVDIPNADLDTIDYAGSTSDWQVVSAAPADAYAFVPDGDSKYLSTYDMPYPPVQMPTGGAYAILYHATSSDATPMLVDIGPEGETGVWELTVETDGSPVTLEWNNLDADADAQLGDTTLLLFGDPDNPDGIPLDDMGSVTFDTSKQLEISLGGAASGTHGSLSVVDVDEGGEEQGRGGWQIWDTDGETEVDNINGTQISPTDPDNEWYSTLPGFILRLIPEGTYLIKLDPIDYSYQIRDAADNIITEFEVTIADQKETPEITYERIPAGLDVRPAGGLVVAEGTSSSQLQVQLTSKPLGEVTVDVTAENDDITIDLAPASLTFTPDNWNEPQSVPLSAALDETADDEPFTITLTPTSDEDDRFAAVEVEGTILDTTRPLLLVERTDTGTSDNPRQTSESGTTAQFEVSLASQPTAAVDVTVESTMTTEGTVDPTSLTFPTDDWGTPQTVTVTGVDDGDLDGDVAYSVVCRAASDDSDYEGRTQALSYVNLDDENAGGASADLVFIPGERLAFGSIPVGGTRTRTLTVYNAGDTDWDLTATIDSGTHAAGFTLDGGTPADITVPTESGVQIEVTATAGDSASPAPTRATLRFEPTAGGDPVAAIALSLLTVAPPDGGTLAISPTEIVVEDSGEVETGEFDVSLDSDPDVRFGSAVVRIELPDFVEVTGVETNTARTSGWNFGYEYDPVANLLTACYTDPDFDGAEGTGIEPGDETLFTVSFEVNTTAAGDDVYGTIAFQSAIASDETTDYLLHWPDAPARATPDGLLGTVDGFIAVSNKFQTATLDVDESHEGTQVTFDDIILIFRYTQMGLTTSTNIISGMSGYTAEDGEAIISNIQRSLEAYDVDESHGGAQVTFDDIIFMFRYTQMGLTTSTNIISGIPGYTADDGETIVQNIASMIVR